MSEKSENKFFDLSRSLRIFEIFKFQHAVSWGHSPGPGPIAAATFTRPPAGGGLDKRTATASIGQSDFWVAVAMLLGKHDP